MRFLVVDDVPTVRAQLAAYLRSIVTEPPLIAEAASATAAVAAFHEEKPDHVFLDLVLEGEQRTLHALPADPSRTSAPAGSPCSPGSARPTWGRG